MAKNTQLTNLAVNTEANALAALCNSGQLKIYDGTQPATGDTAITTQNLLVTLTLNATAFAAAAAGVLTANAITSGTAGASGTASWFRLFQSDGTTAMWDGSVGTADANLIIPSTSITSGVTIGATSFTHTIAKSTAGS
jgi:hypothetical protein